MHTKEQLEEIERQVRPYTAEEKRAIADDHDRRMRQQAGFTGKVRHKPTNITPKKKKRKK